MIKKIFMLMCIVSVVLVSVVSAAPKKAYTILGSNKAVIAARAEIGEEPVLYGYTEKDGKAIINFRNNDTYLEYEVEVILATSKVKEMEIKGSNIAGSTTIRLTADDIRRIILETYPDARNITVTMKKEGVNTHYEAEFVTKKYKAEADMNPFTGAFAKRELEYF